MPTLSREKGEAKTRVRARFFRALLPSARSSFADCEVAFLFFTPIFSIKVGVLNFKNMKSLLLFPVAHRRARFGSRRHARPHSHADAPTRQLNCGQSVSGQFLSGQSVNKRGAGR